MKTIVQIIGAADGRPTPHDGKWLVSWDPHTRFGTLACMSTSDPNGARRFRDAAAALAEWRTISRAHPLRPDGQPNRPLSGLTVEFTQVPE